MITESPRYVGRNVRGFLFTVIESMFPRLSTLGRDHFVGQVVDIDYWTGNLRRLFEQEWKAAEETASAARKGDAERGIPTHMTFRRANELKEVCNRFERELKAAGEADEAAFAARPAKGAKAVAIVPGTFGEAVGADELQRMSQQLATAQSGQASVAKAPASTTAPVAAH
ncbi:MAG: hypothetical protein AAB431_04020 [Patescibacteria group bacterium]